MAAFHQPLEVEVVAVHVVMDEDSSWLALGERNQLLTRQRPAGNISSNARRSA